MQKIPLLTVKAGPRDGADWVRRQKWRNPKESEGMRDVDSWNFVDRPQVERLKEELAALIKYVQINKAGVCTTCWFVDSVWSGTSGYWMPIFVDFIRSKHLGNIVL